MIMGLFSNICQLIFDTQAVISMRIAIGCGLLLFALTLLATLLRCFPVPRLVLGLGWLNIGLAAVGFAAGWYLQTFVNSPDEGMWLLQKGLPLLCYVILAVVNGYCIRWAIGQRRGRV